MADGAATRYILDSFAALAFLQGEPGGASVRQILRAAVGDQAEITMSVINLGEVLYLVEHRRGAETAGAVVATIEQLPIRIVDADLAWTLRAARVKAAYPVSFADAFAIALAKELDACVVTGDPEFAAVEGLVAIQWLGSGGRGC